ncbi:hypothetical protein A8C32_00860 [Flavivirga aquatica]|uniref:Glycosyltransferase 2-like domain-containing protein n=1 Tax=Flavivirga aquatica TaxID=1849968 RepID=A0A1E5TBY5_9FLAO|nr:glycosyltransferase family A protein [Flavivirga aquatica]OEK08859.1 hypothetical protein A8C32_00860 [Flavivirga aquatica]
MILLIHNNNVVTQVFEDHQEHNNSIHIGQKTTKVLLSVAELYPQKLIMWCHDVYKDDINTSGINSIFHHKRILATYTPDDKEYLPESIGYIERSYFLKIKKDVSYPTWIMNNAVGGIHASVILNLKKELNFNTNFNYFLNALAKRAMVEGLFCYSEPKLLRKGTLIKLETKQASIYQLFKFVKQHYKWVWIFFMSICLVIYEKKLVILPILRSLFYRKLNTNFNLEAIKIQSKRKLIDKREIDVIIPTIGREKYLYNVLKDFSKQTILPKNIIIVEQNSEVNSKSKLDYLTNQDWPFKIKHHFINKLGVCNARNLALKEVKSEWVFLGDDDNRFEPNLIEDLFKNIETTGNKVGTTVYLQPHEKQTYFKTAQTGIFGAGNSILRSDLLKNVSFNTKFEFNYGEDNEFGMQLRTLGEDVIFYSKVKIKHLKAPIGGYRTKFKQLWAEEAIQPKPSPTIQLLNQTYFTKKQIKGYKMVLFFRLFKSNFIFSPFKQIACFKKQWEQSLHWSTKL